MFGSCKIPGSSLDKRCEMFKLSAYCKFEYRLRSSKQHKKCVEGKQLSFRRVTAHIKYTISRMVVDLDSTLSTH